MFRGFVFGKLVLTGDAVPYFDHFKYYIDSLMKGIYPMWDPFVPDGVPNEFFLRRIGSFNPFYFLMIVFRCLGLRFELAYLLFLTLYFWLGMIGFYLLSFRLFRDRNLALISYLLLMFSSMSTVLFSSFLMLSVVPIVWFSYFLMCFFEKTEKHSLLGVVFCLMIIATTYLPFYFLHNFLLGILCFVLIFPVKFFDFLRKAFLFCWQNKVFLILSLVCLLLAFSSGFLFFKEMASGNYVMPVRHKDIDTLNTLMVAPQTYIDGGIMATILVDEQMNYFDKFILGRFYIPIIFCIFMLLGIAVQINKRILFFLSWAFLALISGVYEASPVYKFLYEHIFYIKYMRNFQYFLWINLLPILVLLSVENLRVFFQTVSACRDKKTIYFMFIAVVHVGLMIYFILQKTGWVIPGSLILSAFAFYQWIVFERKESYKWIWGILLVSLIIHPIQISYYLNRNSLPKTGLYNYETTGPHNFIFGISEQEQALKIYNDQEINKILVLNEWPVGTWFDLKSNFNFKRYLPPEAVDAQFKLELYDQVDRKNYASPDYRFMAKILLRAENRAIISEESLKSNFESKNVTSLAMMPPHKQVVASASQQIKLNKFEPNKVELSTDLKQDKFLVYRDNYERRWEVFIDGKKEALYKANLTFKGVWIPAGQHTVQFLYGSGWYEYYNIFLLMLFCGVILWLFYYIIRKYSLIS